MVDTAARADVDIVDRLNALHDAGNQVFRTTFLHGVKAGGPREDLRRAGDLLAELLREASLFLSCDFSSFASSLRRVEQDLRSVAAYTRWLVEDAENDASDPVDRRLSGPALRIAKSLEVMSEELGEVLDSTGDRD